MEEPNLNNNGKKVSTGRIHQRCIMTGLSALYKPPWPTSTRGPQAGGGGRGADIKGMIKSSGYCLINNVN